MNNLWASVDAYCERMSPAFWAEPLNAVSNAAFLLAALAAWTMARRAGRDGDWAVRALVVNLVAIGIGSFLFHTFAQRWAGTADVLPIMIFILLYLHLAVVRYIGLPAWAGMIKAAMFLPVSAGLGAWLLPALGPLNGSIGYVPTFLVLVAFATGLALAAHDSWPGLAVAAALFAMSLAFRTLDDQSGAICEAFPSGTHWAWHLLNGALLGVLAVTFVRHGAPGTGLIPAGRLARDRTAG
ncbi:MAG: ceramidase domain-containing protein [Pseudomonadota bacterium]|nr:ceramidase domain-containing protein [Pseudomonadota bacterium]